MNPYPKPQGCENCPYFNMPGPVWASGNPNSAALVYIGQNPAPDEWEAKEPFAGASGRILNRQLFETKIGRHELYIDNIVKCLTPRVAGGYETPKPEAVKLCRRFLDASLQRARADTVLLAGALAFDTLIGTYSTLSPRYHPHTKQKKPVSLMARMGCVEQRDGRKWIGTIHPAFIMRMPMFRQAPIEHLKKAWKISGVEVPLPKLVYPSDREIEEAISVGRTTHYFADDVETNQVYGLDDSEEDYVGNDYKLTMCGFGVRPYEALVVKPDRIHLWRELFDDPLTTQFEHNGEYDRYYLETICPQNNKRFDTMLAHHYLFNNMRQALKPHVLSLYTNLPYYDRSLNLVDPELYNAMDVVTTYLAGLKMERMLKEEGMWDIFNEIGMPMLHVLENWRREGLRVDIRRALLYKELTHQKLEKVEELIAKMLGPFFSWQSPKQVGELFYERWKLPEQFNLDKHTKEQKRTTDDDARTALKRWVNATPERREQHKEAVVFFQLLDAAWEQKKLSEYFDRISPDCKIHAQWKEGTDTHRLSTKPNVQNWPTWPIAKGLPSTRSIVIPDHDEDCFIGVDFSQIQLWCYAVWFDIKWLLKVFESGDYLYGIVCENVWKKPFFKEGLPRNKKAKGEWVTELELLRYKAVPLGFLFGRTGDSLAEELGIPKAEGQKIYREWMANIPELPQAHARIKYEMQQKGILRPPPGMKIHYPSPNLQGLNVFGQTPEAFIVKESVVMMEKEFKRWGCKNTRTVLSVHDSILVNVGGGLERPEHVELIYEEIMNPILTRPITWLKNFRFRHEAKVGVMWDWGMQDYTAWKEARCTAKVS